MSTETQYIRENTFNYQHPLLPETEATLIFQQMTDAYINFYFSNM